MPRGPTMPYGEYETTSYPSSFAVGAPQRVRSSPKVASRRNVPASTNLPQPVASDCAITWPPINAWVESALPLNGTCRNCTPALYATSSISRCGDVPVPVEPYDICAGCALAYAMRSLNVLNGDSDFTTTPNV